MNTNQAILLGEIHSTISGWEKNGMPSCKVHAEKLKQLETTTGRLTKALWGGLATLCVALLGILLGV